MPTFKDIPKFPHSHYNAHHQWRFLKRTLEDYAKDFNLNMNPFYQRGHVWTQYQKEKYIEFCLKGGEYGRDILFNEPNIANSRKEPVMELVDGKQRLSAVLEFIDNKVKAFGYFYEQYEDCNKGCPTQQFINLKIIGLQSHKDVIKTYLDFNSGGSIHTPKDLEPAFLMKKFIEDNNLDEGFLINFDGTKFTEHWK